MLKVKDGFAKAIDSTACGLVTEFLLSNGGNTTLNIPSNLGKLNIVAPSATLSPDTIQIHSSSNHPQITDITPPAEGEVATYVIVTKNIPVSMNSTTVNKIMWIDGENPNSFYSSNNIEMVITGFNYNNEVFYRGTIGKYY